MNHYTEAIAVGIATAIVAGAVEIGGTRSSEAATAPAASETEVGGQVELRPRVSGRISLINFVADQEVSKGEVLLVIDPGPYEAAFNKAQRRLAKAQWQYEFAVRDRTSALSRQASHSASSQDLDASVAAVEQAAAAVRADRAALEEAQNNLAGTKVVAPISGIVGRPEVKVGSFVESGYTQLATVLAPGRIKSVRY